MISIFKDDDYYTNISNRALEIVKEFGINIKYIEFCNRFGESFWIKYCILTNNGLAFPTIIKAPQIFQKVVKPIWPEIFVESELDGILFQLWYESIDAIILQLSAEYVFQVYGDKLNYIDFVTLPEVPAEAYYLYDNMQLNIQQTAPFLENTRAPTDWGWITCSFPIHPIPLTPMFEIMIDHIDREIYFPPEQQNSLATQRTKQTRNQAIKQVPIKQVPIKQVPIKRVPSNPTLYDNKKYNWVI
jgi:hypothetical protein